MPSVWNTLETDTTMPGSLARMRRPGIGGFACRSFEASGCDRDPTIAMAGRVDLEVSGGVVGCGAAGDHRGRSLGIDSNLYQLLFWNPVTEVIAGSTGCVFVLRHESTPCFKA